MRHHTKDKGDLGVAKVIVDLIENGYGVYLPLSEHMPFDLIAVSRDGEVRRVQVKYRSMRANGTVMIDFQNTHADTKSIHKTPVDHSMFDCYAIFCPDSDAIYYVRIDELSADNRRQMAIRITRSRNNQVRSIHLASSYSGAKRIFL